MNANVVKILLFTLSACPLGRSMSSVLQEVKDRQEGIELQTVYVDVDTETTNQFRVKANPTTVFTDRGRQELYRFEGFKETEETILLIEQINAGALRNDMAPSENRTSIEPYTIYLYRGDQPVAVETEYVNKTSVKAPRITAIQQLLRTRVEGFENPFPPSSSLESVKFNQECGYVTVEVKDLKGYLDTEKMRTALVMTLAVFGITQVELKLSHQENED